jgi:uncharacterized protein (UPF0210 family)
MFGAHISGMAYRGSKTVFDGLFGEAHIVQVRNVGYSSAFSGFGRKIPPITSIRN